MVHDVKAVNRYIEEERTAANITEFDLVNQDYIEYVPNVLSVGAPIDLVSGGVPCRISRQGRSGRLRTGFSLFFKFLSLCSRSWVGRPSCLRPISLSLDRRLDLVLLVSYNACVYHFQHTVDKHELTSSNSIGATVLSHHVNAFSLVSAFFLFGLGCINIVLGLIFRAGIQDRRSIFAWRERARDFAPSVNVAGHKIDVVDTAEKLSALAGGYLEKKRMDRQNTGLSGSTAVHADSPPPGSRGMGFGRQAEKAAASKGYVLQTIHSRNRILICVSVAGISSHDPLSPLHAMRCAHSASMRACSAGRERAQPERLALVAVELLLLPALLPIWLRARWPRSM